MLFWILGSYWVSKNTPSPKIVGDKSICPFSTSSMGTWTPKFPVAEAPDTRSLNCLNNFARWTIFQCFSWYCHSVLTFSCLYPLVYFYIAFFPIYLLL